jgi:peptidyl-prolyl cis-trans isomerase SurA
VITASDLRREIRVNAFLEGAKPDFSPENKRKTADRMVEQRLVRRELELSRYPTPSKSEVDPMLKEFQQEYYANPADYERALAQYGITDQQVRDHLLWQLTLLRFVEVRFRPGVQVSDEAVASYFEKVIKPAAQLANPAQTISIDDYREQIEDALIEQQVDKDLSAWIDEAKKRTGVEYRSEVFQ